MNDPFVDEIRQYRDAHAARFNYDLKAIYEDIKRREKEREQATGRKFIAPPRRGGPASSPPRTAPAVAPSSAPSPENAPSAEALDGLRSGEPY